MQTASYRCYRDSSASAAIDLFTQRTTHQMSAHEGEKKASH